MSYKVRLTDTAKEDLRNIATYIAEQAKSKEPAISFVNELRAATGILATFPECGAIPDDRVMKNAGYRFLVHKDYLIFYHYDPKEQFSDILAIFHAKRDYFRVMRKFIGKTEKP